MYDCPKCGATKFAIVATKPGHLDHLMQEIRPNRFVCHTCNCKQVLKPLPSPGHSARRRLALG